MAALDLHWREWGEGDRVALLLHGIMTDATSWEGFAPLLAARGYRVIAPDLRGHGISPRSRNYDLSEFAADVLPQVAGLPLALAIGHSMGGAILGIMNAEISAAKAIYVDPAWNVRQDRPETDASTFVEMARWGDEELLAAHPSWSPVERARQRDALRRWDPYVATYLHARGGIFAVPQTILRPSLVVAAEQSFLVPEAQQRELAAAGFAVRSTGTTDHAPHRESPERLLATLADWI